MDQGSQGATDPASGTALFWCMGEVFKRYLIRQFEGLCGALHASGRPVGDMFDGAT